MARKIKTEKQKKKSKIKVFITVLIVLLVLGGIGFGVWKYLSLKGGNKSVVEVKVLDSLDDYGYSISDKDTKYYQSEFENLKNILNQDEIDYEAYATQVAKMFTIDLYTMSTKINKYDIGGKEYFYADKVSMHEKKVMDTLYSTLLDDTYGDRDQTLPEVKEVTVDSTESMKYTLDDEDVDAYLVKLKITYVDDLNYDDVASVVVCKEEDSIRYSVVDYQPTLSPSYE